MTLDEQRHAIHDMKDDLRNTNREIEALRYRAREKGKLFTLIGETLQGEFPERVVTETQFSDPNIVPIGKHVVIVANLIADVETITAELREALKTRNELQSRLNRIE